MTMQLNNQLIGWSTLDQAIERSPLTISPDTLVVDAIALLSQAQASCVLVVEELQLVGIFIERDVVRLVTSGMDLSQLKVAFVMTRQVITLTQSNSQDVFTALSLMRQHQICHLPIVDKRGQLVGLVTQNSLLQVFEPTAIGSVKEQLRLALDFSYIGSWDWHIHTGKVTWNNNHFRLMGLVPGEVEANYQTWRDRVHPEDIERVEQTLAHSLETHTNYVSEYRIIYPDGSLHWLLAKGRAIYDQFGQPVRMVGIITDLTERKLAEETLRQSEEKFRRLAENMRAAVWMSTPDASHNFYISPAYERIWGRSCQSLRDNPFSWLDAVHPEDRPSVMNQLEQRQLRGKPSNLEYRILQPNGTIRWVWDRSFPIRNERGEIYYFAGIAEDITERKLSEQKISEQAMLLDVATDAIFVCGLDRQILFWNNSAASLYGWSSEEALGKNASELLYQEITPQLQEALKTVFESGSWQGELRKVDKFGKEIIVASRWTLVQDQEGQPKSILTVDTDITEQKKIAAQFLRVQRLESIGTLAGGIAHDLNNVLAPILMLVGLLQLQSPENQQLLKILEDNVKRGAALVKQVLSFARGLEGERTIVQVRHLILEIAQIVKQTFPKSIEFSTDIAPDLWTVSADTTQLHQVLMNFCVNALDAMPNGGTLSIGATNLLIDESYARMNIEAKVGPHVVITVTDTGTGIPPEIIERIFDPFFTTKEVGKGTGLGLSTALGIIKSHGGFVKVYSEVGKGSRFKVYLPTSEEAATQIAEAKDPELLTGHGKLILVVDDEAPVCEITKTTLESHKYQVLTANNGIEALALYVQYQHDICLVLIDMMMPEMDGMVTILALKRMNPQVQIVAMSGLPSSQAIAKARGTGVQGFLSKPFTAKELLHTLQKVLT